MLYFWVTTALNHPSVEAVLSFKSGFSAKASRGLPLAARNERSLGWMWCNPTGMPSMQTLCMPDAFQRGTGLSLRSRLAALPGGSQHSPALVH